MSINLEKIDLLKERANVTYKEAKEALENCDGDLVEALIWLEEAEKMKESQYQESQSQQKSQERHRPSRDFGQKIEDAVKKVHSMRFKIFKNGDTLLNIPATVALVVGVFTMPVSIFVLLLAVVFRYHIAVVKPDGDEIVVDEAVKNTVREEFRHTEKTPDDKVQGSESDAPYNDPDSHNQ